jgi:hypothetical protein
LALRHRLAGTGILNFATGDKEQCQQKENRGFDAEHGRNAMRKGAHNTGIGKPGTGGVAQPYCVSNQSGFVANEASGRHNLELRKKKVGDKLRWHRNGACQGRSENMKGMDMNPRFSSPQYSAWL